MINWEWIKFLSDNNNQAASPRNNKPRVSFLYGPTNLARVSRNQRPAQIIWRASHLMRTTPPFVPPLRPPLRTHFRLPFTADTQISQILPGNLAAVVPELWTVPLNILESDIWSCWSFFCWNRVQQRFHSIFFYQIGQIWFGELGSFRISRVSV